MNRIGSLFFWGYITISSQALLAMNHTFMRDALGLAGKYQCMAYDSHDGAYSGNLTLELDEAASDFEHHFGAYTFTFQINLNGERIAYSGMAAAHGDSVALYFENNNHKTSEALTDRGIEIISVSHDQDRRGQFKTTLHGFYFKPNYRRQVKASENPGGHGTGMCVRI